MGCASPDAFAGVNQAVADVSPGQIGHLALNVKVGTGRPLSEPAGRHVAVLVTSDANEAASKVDGALAAAGFTQVTANGWERRKAGQYVSVGVTIQDSGTKITWTGQTVPAGQTAVLLDFSRST